MGSTVMMELEATGFMGVPFEMSVLVSFWELFDTHPAVFVRVANTGVTGYLKS
jgi:hypothetical protein